MKTPRLLMESGGAPVRWADNSTVFLPCTRLQGQKLIVPVRCNLGDIPEDYFALLDTGAEWTVVGGDLARLVGGQASPCGESKDISTRLGPVTGELHRVDVTLLADTGKDQRIDATILLCPEWDGPIVLGYRGLLERLRFALAPDLSGDDNRFYFSLAG